MMPPKKPLPHTDRDKAPYPYQALELGGGRWMCPNGNIVTKLGGLRACSLKPSTVKFWEAAALRAQGTPLSELIV